MNTAMRMVQLKAPESLAEALTLLQRWFGDANYTKCENGARQEALKNLTSLETMVALRAMEDLNNGILKQAVQVQRMRNTDADDVVQATRELRENVTMMQGSLCLLAGAAGVDEASLLGAKVKLPAEAEAMHLSSRRALVRPSVYNKAQAESTTQWYQCLGVDLLAEK